MSRSQESRQFAFSIGQEVEACWDESDWHIATIADRQVSGKRRLYDLTYSDGSTVGTEDWTEEKLREVDVDAFHSVPNSSIKAPEDGGDPALTSSFLIDNIKRHPRVPKKLAFTEGDTVEVLWPAMQQWYTAVIVSGRISNEGKATYCVQYDDLSQMGTTNLKEEHIRAHTPSPVAPRPEPSRAPARKAENKSLVGKKLNDAVKKEKSERKQQVQETPAPEGVEGRRSRRQVDGFMGSPFEYTVGQHVGVHWGNGVYYGATISSAEHDGAKQIYSVHYDDNSDNSGTLTTGVTLGKLKHDCEVTLQPTATPADEEKAAKAELREETQKKKRKREEAMPQKHLIEPVDEPVLSKRRQLADANHTFTHEIGDSVEVSWGAGHWYPAKIASARVISGIDLYNVEYADGSLDHSSNLKNGVLRKCCPTKFQSQIGLLRAHLEEEVSGRCWPLKTGFNRVGRGEANDVKVESTYATSFHASVFLNGDGTATVKDLGSTNKTWIRSPGDSKHVELAPNIDYTIKEDFRFRVANINYKLKFS